MTQLLENYKNYKKIHAQGSLCNTFSNFHQKMFFSEACLLLVVYHLIGNVTRNYDFFISSVYAKVITVKTFFRNENIVSRKKLSEKNDYSHQRYENLHNDFLTTVDQQKNNRNINTSYLKEFAQFC